MPRSRDVIAGRGCIFRRHVGDHSGPP